MPIFRAAGLWVLSTMEGEGDIDGEGEGEDIEEEEEACLVSCEEAGEDEVCLMSTCLSAGDAERDVGGSEELREEREGMLEVELWEGVGARWAGGDGLDADDKLDVSWWL